MRKNHTSVPGRRDRALSVGGARRVGARALLASAAAVAFLSLPSACSTHGHEEGAQHGDADAAHGHGNAEGDHHGEEGGGDHHEGLAGRPGELDAVGRTVRISMTDAMDYTPSTLAVRRGETVRFEVSNDGQLVHEFVLGTTEEILEHHEMMKRLPGMEHDEPNSVSLAPGTTGEVIWEFSEAGEVTFACLQPGHYEAGMTGEVVVSAEP